MKGSSRQQAASGTPAFCNVLPAVERKIKIAAAHFALLTNMREFFFNELLSKQPQTSMVLLNTRLQQRQVG